DAEQLNADHPKLRDFKLKLAWELSRGGRFQDALQIYEAVLRQTETAGRPTFEIHHGISICYLGLKRYAEAVVHAEEVWRHRSQMMGQQTAWFGRVYAGALHLNGESSAADEIDRQVLVEARKLDPNNIRHAVWLERIAHVFAHHKDWETAARFQRQAVVLERETRVPLHPRLADRLTALAAILRKQDCNEEALGLLQEAAEIYVQQLPLDDPRINGTQNQIISLKAALTLQGVTAD
ncbi:MAG: tetratricopeptide repeat protein, partial [Planctomycetaceae bacterium]|nr:tetratricopeptide repeat protein [Planctomycetaceae bacterium]